MNSQVQTPRQPARPEAVKIYRCKSCKKVLFEAHKVKGLSKRCPRCKTVNIYDE